MSMSNYKSYFLRQLGLNEDQFKPVTTDPETIEPDELKAGIDTEHEHTEEDTLARKIALHHLGEDPHYYSRMKKAGLKEFTPMSSIMSPTAKFPPVLGISVRGSVTGGMPSGGMPTLGPTSLVPSSTATPPDGTGVDPKSSSALGGLELVSKQTPNSMLVNKTPQNTSINSPNPISSGAPTTPAEEHPLQVQQVSGEPVQALTGTSADNSAPTGETPNPKQFEVGADDGEQEESGQETNGTNIEVPDEEEANGNDSDASNVLKEGKHKPGCQCGFCKNKGTFGKRNVKDGNDDPEEDEKHEQQFRKDRAASSEGENVRDYFKTDKKKSVDETFSKHMHLMREKLGIKTNECKPCQCDKPNTTHMVSRTPKK